MAVDDFSFVTDLLVWRDYVSYTIKEIGLWRNGLATWRTGGEEIYVGPDSFWQARATLVQAFAESRDDETVKLINTISDAVGIWEQNRDMFVRREANREWTVERTDLNLASTEEHLVQLFGRVIPRVDAAKVIATRRLETARSESPTDATKSADDAAAANDESRATSFEEIGKALTISGDAARQNFAHATRNISAKLVRVDFSKVADLNDRATLRKFFRENEKRNSKR